MSSMTIEAGVSSDRVAKDKGYIGLIAIMTLTFLSIGASLAFPVVDDAMSFVDDSVPQIVTINGP
jgi:hypothetical protein